MSRESGVGSHDLGPHIENEDEESQGEQLLTPDSRLAAAKLRPARVCRQLLTALDVSEGRRRRRKRNTTPDALGMAIKRRLLEQAIQHDPDPRDFEGWLWERCLSWDEMDEGSSDPGVSASGPVHAMALTILAEWQLAQSSVVFRHWLDTGAPSADADST